MMERAAKLESDSDQDSDNEDDVLEAQGDLLIGDSLIRDIQPVSRSLTVESHGGARFNDLRRCIKTIKPYKRRYKNIYIVCGTNDISTKKSVDRTTKECEKLLDAAKTIADKVHLSSILPRTDEHSHTEKIASLNEELAKLAGSKEVSFINSDQNFTYRDGTVDSSLLSPTDGLHLSSQGVAKLLQNLKIQKDAKAATESPAKRWHHKQKAVLNENKTNTGNLHSSHGPAFSTKDDFQHELRFRGGHSPLSNFYETPVTIWGIQFRSTEHSFQYRKAVAMDSPSAANEILNARTPREAKSIGDGIHANQGWLNVQQDIMYQILHEKAVQCKVFYDYLKETGSKVLVEDTESHFWGRGKSGNGSNILGQLLMSLRDNLPNIQKVPSMSNRSHHFTNAIGSRSNTSTNRRDQICCFNCGEPSHTVNRCRYSHPIQCYACRGEGHKQKICPQKAYQDTDLRRSEPSG